jgi:hypothetical protein
MSKRSSESREPDTQRPRRAAPTGVERLPQDMLACLRKSGQDPISYAGLARKIHQA